MALYHIENLQNGVVILPQPLARRLAPRQTQVMSGPAGMVEAHEQRRYSAMFGLIQAGIIRVTTVEDPARDDNVEVATVSMIKDGTGQYLAVADTPARDAIPAGDRSEGMLVRTNDTGQFWTLGSDLLTWTLVNLGTAQELVGKVYYTYTTPSPLDLVMMPAGSTIDSVEVVVSTVFDAPAATLQVGVTATPGLVLGPFRPAKACTYQSEQDFENLIGQMLKLSIAPSTSTQGSGYVMYRVLL